MGEDIERRNKRINAWQKGKRIVIVTKEREAIKAAAEAAGESVNGFILEAIKDRIAKEKGSRSEK